VFGARAGGDIGQEGRLAAGNQGGKALVVIGLSSGGNGDQVQQH
jgi:hypothetical protein